MSKSPYKNYILPNSTGMHIVMHNFGDWEIDTSYMSRIEKSIYLDMRTLYLKNGKALDADIELLERRLSCNTEEEKQALQFLLKDKFKHCKKTHSFKHSEWETIIKNYRYGNRNVTILNNNVISNADSNESNVMRNAEITNNNVISNADRQAHFRQNRLRMINELSAIGVSVPNNIKMVELKPIYERHFSNVSVTENNADSNASNNSSNACVTNGKIHNAENNVKKHAITNNQEPITNNQEPVENREENSFREEASVLDDEIQAPPSAKLSTAVVIYAKNQGISAAPSQKLNDCISKGATMDMFTEAINTAKERGNSRWDYIIGIVKNRLADAEKMANSATHSPQKSGELRRHFPVKTGYYDKGLIPNDDGSYKF